LPLLIPASTMPMMLVHVKREMPISGARARAATISKIKPQALVINTMMYGLIIGSALISR